MIRISDKRKKTVNMPKSKNRKNHAQKVEARRKRQQVDTYRVQKARKEFFEKIMEAQRVALANKSTEEFNIDLPSLSSDLPLDVPLI
jgi:hypothetical protein